MLDHAQRVARRRYDSWLCLEPPAVPLGRIWLQYLSVLQHLAAIWSFRQHLAAISIAAMSRSLRSIWLQYLFGHSVELWAAFGCKAAIFVSACWRLLSTLPLSLFHSRLCSLQVRGEWGSGLSVAVPQHAASESPDRRAFVQRLGPSLMTMLVLSRVKWQMTEVNVTNVLALQDSLSQSNLRHSRAQFKHITEGAVWWLCRAWPCEPWGGEWMSGLSGLHKDAFGNLH